MLCLDSLGIQYLRYSLIFTTKEIEMTSVLTDLVDPYKVIINSNHNNIANYDVFIKIFG